MGNDRMKKTMWKPTGLALAAIVATAAVAFAVPSAMAQRDPAYAAARAAGQVGEKVDGYLGTVGSQSAAVEAVVRDINIKRKAFYTQQVADGSATIEQFAFTAGCNAIAQTKPGEKYQAPDGSWQTRTAGAPQRDGRCI